MFVRQISGCSVLIVGHDSASLLFSVVVVVPVVIVGPSPSVLLAISS
jgi:hypothetical protein